MAFTSLSPWVVGQRLKAVALNKMVTAIQEIQNEMTTGRVQLRVYNVAAVTLAAVYPYTTVQRDSHSAWNSTTKEWTCPKAGLYLISVGVRTNAAASPAPVVTRNGSTLIGVGYVAANANSTGSYTGAFDLVIGDVMAVAETGNSYTPTNAAAPAQSNYFHITYLGLTS